MSQLEQNNRSVGLIGERTHQITITLPFCPYTSAFPLTIHHAEVNETPLNSLTSVLEKSE